MSYLGNQPNSAAFLTDQFSGNGSTTAFTLSTAPAGTTSLLVSVSGVLQDPTTYSVVGTTLTLGGAAPTGTGNISVRYLGIPASGVVTTAYRTVTEFTATAGQTTFTPPSYSVGFIAVYLNGARLGASDFTASNGTTIVLATGASVDDLVVTESFYISSVANAIPNIPGAVVESNINDGAITTAKILDANITNSKLASNAITTSKVDTSQIATLGTATTYNANYLIVGGGGAGGGSPTTAVTGGGGGAGGFLSGVSSVTVGTSYSITVGAGGSVSSINRGNNGGDSSAFSLTAIGGGGGGGGSGGSAYNLGSAGGSGGGSAGWSSGTLAGGAGTSGQGFAGGIGGGYDNAAGGGGATKAGGNQGTAEHYYTGGDGGLGKVWPINGVMYAGGGGGGSKCPNNTFYYIGGGLPGAGGGGYGGDTVQYSGNQGTANTGGGGGGCGVFYNNGSPDRQGANGGSGIVIIAYLGSQRGSGGTITSVNGYTLHSFTTSGTYTA